MILCHVSQQAVVAEKGSGDDSLDTKVNLCLLNRKTLWGFKVTNTEVHFNDVTVTIK